MKLIVGLGNPGRQYDRTRHNAGYMVIDRLIDRHARGSPARARFNSALVEAPLPDGGGGSEPCLLMKPTTYMNVSGRAVAEATNFYKLNPASDIFVVVDDVALPLAAIRIRPGGGAGGHNGLSDIEQALGTDAYPRLRIGIDPSPAYMDQADYVLGRFTDDQWTLMAPALDRAADAAQAFVASGIDAAMNKFNAPSTPPRPKKPPPEASPGPAG